jgi:regulator of cell morphogenesis and NO signaling
VYLASDKMSDLICGNHESLQLLSRFALPLGFGDKTVAQVCELYHVHTPTFLAVVNYKLLGVEPNIDDISLETLTEYLKRAHRYYLEFFLPMIRRKLIEAINCGTESNKMSFLVIKFFDEYTQEVDRHMDYENKTAFPYVEQLRAGRRSDKFSIDTYARQHRTVDDQHVEAKLTELKNTIIKYFPSTASNDLLNSALFDIFTCEHDLAMHCKIEDDLFVPAVRKLENSLENQPIKPIGKSIAAETESLSEREREVLIEVVKGLSNKEIADKLFISIHTVITHRKNIARKLHIHSPAGLTIYAIANKLVDINSLA